MFSFYKIEGVKCFIYEDTNGKVNRRAKVLTESKLREVNVRFSNKRETSVN